VHSEGKGGILNVQLTGRHESRDHYIDLDYEGWRYHVLATGETSRFYDYQWPHRWTSVMYRRFNYAAVQGVHLIYNGLPAEAETTCLISRLEALREYVLPVESPSIEVAGQRMVFPVSLQPDEYIELDWDGKARHFEPNGGLLADITPQGEVRLETGENVVAFDCEGGDERSTRAEITLAVRGAPLENTAAKPDGDQAAATALDNGLSLVASSGSGLRVLQGSYERVSREPARSIATFDGTANAWTVTHHGTEPRHAALILDYTKADDSVIPDSETATTIEDFSDLTAYDMSDENQYEKYVVGGGKMLSPGGPVREGVTQTLEPCEGPPGEEGPAARYAATNEGAAGGWSGKGRRFDAPLDLSAQKALGLWVHGDAAGEVLMVQFRDVSGAWANWTIPIDYSGWRRQAYRPDANAKFDWSKVEYVIFYYNNIPAGRSVEVRLSGLVGATQTKGAPTLEAPSLTVNGASIPLGDQLLPGHALLLDGDGCVAQWVPGMKASDQVAGQQTPVVLQPGANRFELRCGSPVAPTTGLSVRVVPL